MNGNHTASESHQRNLGVTEPELYALRPLLPRRNVVEPSNAPPWASGSSAETRPPSFPRPTFTQVSNSAYLQPHIPHRAPPPPGAPSVRAHPYRTPSQHPPRPHQPASAIPRRLSSTSLSHPFTSYPPNPFVPTPPAPQSLGPWRDAPTANANGDFALAPYAVAGLHRIRTSNPGREWPNAGARGGERLGASGSLREVKSPSVSRRTRILPELELTPARWSAAVLSRELDSQLQRTWDGVDVPDCR